MTALILLAAGMLIGSALCAGSASQPQRGGWQPKAPPPGTPKKPPNVGTAGRKP